MISVLIHTVSHKKIACLEIVEWTQSIIYAFQSLSVYRLNYPYIRIFNYPEWTINIYNIILKKQNIL